MQHFSFQIAPTSEPRYLLAHPIYPLQNHALPFTILESFALLVCRRTPPGDVPRACLQPDQLHREHQRDARDSELDRGTGSSKHDGAVGHHEIAAGAEWQSERH